MFANSSMRRASVFLACFTLTCAANAAPADYLPENVGLSGWAQEGKPRTFTQDTLWDLMDGGAEVYLEYGVVGAASVIYKDAKKDEVQVEIYAMKDADGAFGIYSFNSRTKGVAVPIGDDAMRTDYFLLVRKGSYFLSFTAVSDPAATMPPCLELARAIAARIPTAPGRPALLSRLPTLAGSAVHDVYFRGSLGLLNLYPFDATDPFNAVEGVAADSGSVQFFVVRHADAKEAAARYESAWKQLSANTKYKEGKSGPDERCLVDDNGKFLLFARAGACNLIAIGADETELHGLLQQALRAKKS
jgi:hypothetical protein